MDNDLMFSRNRNDWETPQELFNLLNEIFKFTVDCAANKYNAKLPKWFGAGTDIVLDDDDSAFMNVPYSPTSLCRKLIKDVFDQARLHSVPAVILLPVRSETSVWQDYIFEMDHVFFFRGRLKFINPNLPSYRVDGNFKISPAPFPSALGIMNVSIDQINLLKSKLRGTLK